MSLSTVIPIPFNDLRRAVDAGEEVAQAIERVARSGRYLLGEETACFERELAEYLGVDEVVAVASGTDALQLALTALAVPGQEILTAANAGGYATLAARRCGLTVRFADVDEGDLLLTPDAVERALTPRTSVVVVTHLYGKMARVEEIREVCSARGVRVLEDCAQAAGARARGALAGAVGDAAAFSFYPTKNLGACGEAGALVSRRADVAARARLIRVHGMEQRYHHSIVGGNFRMEGFQAAVLNTKLPHLSSWTERRRSIARSYLGGIRLEEARLPAVPAHGESVYHQFTITHPRRDALREHLAASGVGADLIYPVPFHLQRCFAGMGLGKGSFPVAERAAETCVSLPIYPELSDDQVSAVIDAVNAFK